MRSRRTGVRISMDGKGRWLDNVYVERLWRSLKQEEVYRRAYETGGRSQERNLRLSALLQRKNVLTRT